MAKAKEFLALLTRDNSAASSRSLMCSKPVTSSALVICMCDEGQSQRVPLVADVQQARQFFKPYPTYTMF